MAIAGGRAFFRRSPLKQLNRDVMAARVHPPAAPVSFQIAGASARAAAGGGAPTGAGVRRSESGGSPEAVRSALGNRHTP